MVGRRTGRTPKLGARSRRSGWVELESGASEESGSVEALDNQELCLDPLLLNQFLTLFLKQTLWTWGSWSWSGRDGGPCPSALHDCEMSPRETGLCGVAP